MSISRRIVVKSIAFGAAGSLFGLFGESNTAAGAGTTPVISRHNNRTPETTASGTRIEGTDLLLQIGGVEEVSRLLCYVVRRYHYEVRPLISGDVLTSAPADWVLSKRLSRSVQNSHAVVILPSQFPPRAVDGHTAIETEVISDILAECGGLVHWGGSRVNGPEALFYIDSAPNKIPSKLKKTLVDGSTNYDVGRPDVVWSVPRSRSRKHARASE